MPKTAAGPTAGIAQATRRTANRSRQGLLEGVISAGWMCHTCGACFEHSIEIGLSAGSSPLGRAPMQTPAWHVHIRGAWPVGVDEASLPACPSVGHGETRRWQSASRVESQQLGWGWDRSSGGRPVRTGLGQPGAGGVRGPRVQRGPKRTRPQTISLFPPSPGGGSRKFMGLPFVFLGDGSLLGTRVQALFSGPSRCSLARVMGCQGTGRQGPGVCCTALDSPWTRPEGQASPGRPWSALAWCCRGPIAMRRCVSSQLQSVAVAARHRYRIFAEVQWMRVRLPAGNKEG